MSRHEPDSVVPASGLPMGHATVSGFPLNSRAARYERLGFTFCKMGTTGLIAWALSPPIFVLLVGSIAIVLYARAFAYGLTGSRCVFRKPLLIIGFWGAVLAVDMVWLLHLGPFS